MSGSETGVMSSPEPFIIGLQRSPVQSQIQNMRLAYNADGCPVYQPVGASSPTYQSSVGGPNAGIGVFNGEESVGGGINMNLASETMKKKRGRPRKYGPDGTMALVLTPTPSATSVTQSSGGFSPAPTTVAPPPGGSGSGSAPPNSFKKRGRPPGSTSSKKQQIEALATLGLVGVGFTPHVITVMAGEDVSSKIMSFSQRGTRAVCVLSANGAISNVTLRQAATSGGSVTYEGRFEILSLSGSFLLNEHIGARSRTRGLTVSLSGPDGRVLGGSVAGLLIAASPVQVVVGSFAADGRKESKSTHQMDTLYAPTKFTPSGGPTGSPSSRCTLSESSGGVGSPLNQSTDNNSNPQGMFSMPWK